MLGRRPPGRHRRAQTPQYGYVYPYFGFAQLFPVARWVGQMPESSWKLTAAALWAGYTNAVWRPTCSRFLSGDSSTAWTEFDDQMGHGRGASLALNRDAATGSKPGGWNRSRSRHGSLEARASGRLRRRRPRTCRSNRPFPSICDSARDARKRTQPRARHGAVWCISSSSWKPSPAVSSRLSPEGTRVS